MALRLLILISLTGIACGAQPSSEKAEIDALIARTFGLAEHYQRWLGPVPEDDEAPFASKDEALGWLAKLERYDPNPPPSREAFRRLVLEAPADADDAWVAARLDRIEAGPLMGAVRAFHKLVVSGYAFDFDASEWQRLRDAFVGFSLRTANAANFVSVMVSLVLLDIAVTTPELALPLGFRADVTKIFDSTKEMRKQYLAESRTMPVLQGARSELLVCDGLRDEISAAVDRLTL